MMIPGDDDITEPLFQKDKEFCQHVLDTALELQQRSKMSSPETETITSK